MQAYLYRWRLAAGREREFATAWSSTTERLRTLGSYGSRLHRGSDGWWYAYAQWPDEATRMRAFAASEVADDQAAASAIMRGAIVESLPEVALDVCVDHLVAVP